MSATCTFPECGREHYAKGLCRGHYTRQRRGAALQPLGPPRYHVAPKTCEFPGCAEKHATSGLCDTHDHQRRAGQPLTPIDNRRGKPLAWLENALASRSRGEDCWLDWPFARGLSSRRIVATDEGDFWRPHLSFEGKVVRAARLVLYFENGRWPRNALHRCDRPGCLNPAHLYDGTQAQNIRDMLDRGRARRIPKDRRS